MTQPQGKVYIVGGGPGDPELLTLKAKSVIESADVIIYADSLVHPSVLDFAKPGAEIHGSKTMNLGEIVDLTLAAVRQGKTVARIQSGDPSIYGAVLEQMRLLEAEHVDYEIIPGVCSAFAAAARLKVELTVPGGPQSIIMTRAEGRVSMPEGEDLKSLAAHGTSLILFLSVSRMVSVVRQLIEAGYTESTPVAVVYRVGWPDEIVIRSTLSDIAAKVRDAKFTLQALVMVGEAMNPNLIHQVPTAANGVASSHLYSSDYTHLYRTGDGESPDDEEGGSAGD